MSNANPGFGVGFQIGDGGTKSSFVTDAGNSGITWEARIQGISGDAITIELALSGINAATTAAAVGNAITVTLESADGIAILATAQDVIDAVRADNPSNVLVTVTNVGDGTGVVTEETPAVNLAGGVDEVYSSMAEVAGIPGFGTTQRTSEITHMSSTDGWVEQLGLGLKEGKAFSVPLNFVADDSDQVLLYQTRVEDGTTNNYRILFTDDSGSSVTFASIIQDTDINHDRDSHAQMTVTFLPTKEFNWA